MQLFATVNVGVKISLLRAWSLKALVLPFYVLAGLLVITGILVAQEDDRTPLLQIHTGTGNPRGAVITLSSRAEPVVQIGTWDKDSTVDVALYTVNKEFLLNYLRHTSEGKRITERPDVSQLEKVADFTKDVVGSYSSGAKISLPIGESGIWYLVSNWIK